MMIHDEMAARLQDLHIDLLDLNSSRLANIDRLWRELEAQMAYFRDLLDKRPQNPKSRSIVDSGSIEINDKVYTINPEFIHDTIGISAILETDELDVAKLYVEAQNKPEALEQSPVAYVIVGFHQRRQLLVECLRLSMQSATDLIDEDSIYGPLKLLLSDMLSNQSGGPEGTSWYWRKCLSNMADIEVWLHKMADRAQSDSITGQSLPTEIYDALEFQRVSLFKQHESLGAILHYLIKSNNTSVEDFRLLLMKLKSSDRYDGIFVHYLPALFAFIFKFGYSETSCSLQEAKSLNEMLITNKDGEQWSLRPVQAAAFAIWLAEYSARYTDTAVSFTAEIDLVSESDQRISSFLEALHDGAFHFLLRLCQDVKSSDWLDLAQFDFTSFLVRDKLNFQTDQFEVETFLRDILMEQLQVFVDSVITNMPDCLRRLRHQEDEQRRQILGRSQLNPFEYELDFERFLVLISHAFSGYPEAAETFWSDSDSNLFGFLHWAAQRQSTPRAAAFCEMLRSISTGRTCADATHSFLLDEGPYLGSKSRKHASLSWLHILKELEFYSTSIKENQTTQQRKKQEGQIMELESPMMLESYLRLLSRVCQESPAARIFILMHPAMPIHEHLLLLCSDAAESRLRACAFMALTSLLTEKSRETGDVLWTSLDSWMYGSFAGSPMKARHVPFANSADSTNAFIHDFLAIGIEEPTAFVNLLQALIAPSSENHMLNDDLPFPENLGAAYRMSGIEPYVDFVLGQVFTKKSTEVQETQQLYQLRLSCLEFIATCLLSFNEALAVYANYSSISVDSAIRTSTLAAYVRLHPFARTMEWLFNENTNAALFDCVDQEQPDFLDPKQKSAQMLCLIRGIEIIHLVLSLQCTYFDLVRPIIKSQSSSRRPVVASSALASFEDAILNHFGFITKMGQYCNLGNNVLTIQCLRLLNVLSTSRKIATSSATGSGRLMEKSRLVLALEMGNDIDNLSKSMKDVLQFRNEDSKIGQSSIVVSAKRELLRLLINSMESAPERPNVAHLLLGFTCHVQSTTISHHRQFMERRTLFHALLNFLVENPIGDDETIICWLMALKEEAIELLQMLWSSDLSSGLVLSECQRNDVLALLWIQLVIIGPQTLWDGRSIHDIDFFISDSAASYTTFLKYRTILLRYAAIEVTSAVSSNVVSWTKRLRSMLLGTTTLQTGQNVQSLSIFDLIDFFDVRFGETPPLPESKWLNISDLRACRVEGKSDRYSIQHAEQLLRLKQEEALKSGLATDFSEQQRIQADAENILLCLHTSNIRADMDDAYASCFTSWTQLVIIMLEACNLDASAKHLTVVRLLQLVVPRLERSYTENILVSGSLAQLGHILINHLSLEDRNIERQSSADMASDNVFQLFRVALIGIQCPQATPEVREPCYAICQTYLNKTCLETGQKMSRRHALQLIMSLGQRLVEILFDDAYTGEGGSQTSAMLLLGTIISSFNLAGSSYIREALVRLNFLQLSIDMIRHATLTLREDVNQDLAQLSMFHGAMLVTISRFCQARQGANQILNAGLFNAVRDSQLFSTDPDMELEPRNLRAATCYLQLLLSVLRVINAVVLSQSFQNEKVIVDVRHFLEENRPAVLALYKQNSRADKAASHSSIIKEIVNSFTILIVVSGFSESSQLAQKVSDHRGFT